MLVVQHGQPIRLVLVGHVSLFPVRKQRPVYNKRVAGGDEIEDGTERRDTVRPCPCWPRNREGGVCDLPPDRVVAVKHRVRPGDPDAVIVPDGTKEPPATATAWCGIRTCGPFEDATRPLWEGIPAGLVLPSAVTRSDERFGIGGQPFDTFSCRPGSACKTRCRCMRRGSVWGNMPIANPQTNAKPKPRHRYSRSTAVLTWKSDRGGHSVGCCASRSQLQRAQSVRRARMFVCTIPRSARRTVRMCWRGAGER